MGLRIIIPIAIAVAVVVIYAVFPKVKGLYFTSRLACPKCHGEFEYAWVPGGSFNTVRLGKRRYMRCPKCGRWSWFDIVSTIIKRNSNA